MDISKSLELRIYYVSGWSSPKIHFGFKLSLNTYSNWKTQTLQKFKLYKDIWYADIQLLSPNFDLEFLFCNNEMTEWDHPAITKHCSSQNYNITLTGQYIVYIGKLLKIDEADKNFEAKNKILVITDLDGTLFGDCEKGKKALKNFNEFWLKKLAFGISNKKMPLLVYSTGRDYGLFEELQKKAHLLWPDYFIGGTGTYIFKYNNETGLYDKDVEWQNNILSCWDFDIISSYFDNLPGFNRHFNDERIEKYNLHYWCTAIDFQESQDQIEEIKNKLLEKNVQINVITSGPGDYRYVDITSFHANKGKALEYLAGKLGFQMKDVFSFGDSMNDIDMLVKSKGGSYLVANSQEEIVTWMRTNQKKKSFIVQQSPYEYADALYYTLSKYYSNAEGI